MAADMSQCLIIAILMFCLYQTASAQCSQILSDADRQAKEIALNSIEEFRNVSALHQTPYQMYLHLTSLMASAMFTSSEGIILGSNRFLVSNFKVNDVQMAHIFCAFFGGHLPELKTSQIFLDVTRKLRRGTNIDCMILGMERGEEDDYYYTYSEQKAFTAFKDVNNHPEARYVDVKRNGMFFMESRVLLASYECSLVCQLPK